MLSITAPTRLPTSWTPAVPPPACDTIGELPYEYIRWIENKDIDLNKLVGTSDMKKIKDLKGNPLLLWVNSWSIGMTLDRNEGLVLSEFGTN